MAQKGIYGEILEFFHTCQFEPCMSSMGPNPCPVPWHELGSYKQLPRCCRGSPPSPRRDCFKSMVSTRIDGLARIVRKQRSRWQQLQLLEGTGLAVAGVVAYFLAVILIDNFTR